MEVNGIRHGIDFTLATHCHDEWVVEVTQDEAQLTSDLALDAIRAAGETYNLAVELSGVSEVGRTWAEVH